MAPRDYIPYSNDADRVKDEIRCDPDASNTEIVERLLGEITEDEVARIRSEMQA